MSSNGGLLLASKAEKAIGIVSAISKCIKDWRKSSLVDFTVEEMVLQRVYQITAGYEDADDCDLLRNDTILKMSRGRHSDDADLCSQPTMSRLENHISSRELYKIGVTFVKNFVRSYEKEPQKIILDLDDSNAWKIRGELTPRVKCD